MNLVGQSTVLKVGYKNVVYAIYLRKGRIVKAKTTLIGFEINNQSCRK